MKWVKVAIGAVIAIAVVPMIAISVFNLTQEKVREEIVIFEVLTLDTEEYNGSVTDGTFSKTNQYSNLVLIGVDAYDIINITSILYNSNEVIIDYTRLYFGELSINGNNDELYITIGSNDTITDFTNITLGDTFEITFEVTTPPILSGVTATLLLLAPLIFVSGILYFIYNNKQEGI